jgi:hypothetical protein
MTANLAFAANRAYQSGSAFFGSIRMSADTSQSQKISTKQKRRLQEGTAARIWYKRAEGAFRRPRRSADVFVPVL